MYEVVNWVTRFGYNSADITGVCTAKTLMYAKIVPGAPVAGPRLGLGWSRPSGPRVMPKPTIAY